MVVRYVPIDGEIVSAEWYVAITDMRADGVYGVVREGKRTLARQWYFWNGYISHTPGFNLAAYPSIYAPHIREGRLDHAIDFGNDAEVFAWLESHGLHPVRTVRGESWHIECPAWALIAYARTHGEKPDPYRLLRKDERNWAHKIDFHQAARAKEAATGKGKEYRRHDREAKHYRKLLVKRMRSIRKYARREKNGWARYHRATRYQLIRRALK